LLGSHIHHGVVAGVYILNAIVKPEKCQQRFKLETAEPNFSPPSAFQQKRQAQLIGILKC